MDACGVKAGPAELTFEGQMKSNGLFARTISIDHLEELKEDLESLRRNGLFDPAFNESSLASFDFTVPADLPGAKTIVVVAKPKPMLSVIFRWQGRKIPLLVPPGLRRQEGGGSGGARHTGKVGPGPNATSSGPSCR